MCTTETVNSRVEELEFLISVLNDLAFKYPNHNTKLLEEIISNFKYRRDTEETTIIAKARSEVYQHQKCHK